jgi:hypothetical protein
MKWRTLFNNLHTGAFSHGMSLSGVISRDRIRWRRLRFPVEGRHVIATVYGMSGQATGKCTVLNGHQVRMDHDDPKADSEVCDYFLEGSTLRIFNEGASVTYQRQREGA